MSKVQIGLVLFLAVAIFLVIFDLVARHEGAVGCVNRDTAATNKQEVTNVKVEAAGTVAEAAEGQNRENALGAPVAPTPVVPPGVCAPPVALGAGKVPAARPAPAAGEPTAPVDVRAAGAPGVVPETWDAFIRSDVQRARAADIEIADRDRLLVERDAVCRGISPPKPPPLVP